MFEPGDKVKVRPDKKINLSKETIYTVEDILGEYITLKGKGYWYAASYFKSIKENKRDFVVKDPINKPKE